jgi:hypothetical protein
VAVKLQKIYIIMIIIIYFSCTCVVPVYLCTHVFVGRVVGPEFQNLHDDEVN